MGTMLTAFCEKCGFNQGVLYYGVGFMKHNPIIPALKKDTHELLMEEFTDDPTLKFYHQKDMYKGEIPGDGIQCFDIHLSHEHNLCPGCGMFTMEFEEVGNWD